MTNSYLFKDFAWGKRDNAEIACNINEIYSARKEALIIVCGMMLASIEEFLLTHHT